MSGTSDIGAIASAGPGLARRTRIVQVVNSLAIAGAERTTIEIAKNLDAEEFDSRVIVVRDGPLRGELERAGVPVYVTGGEFDLRAPVIVRDMTRLLREIEPDLVHTHMIGSDIVGGVSARRAGVPVVMTTQHDVYRRRLPYRLWRRLTGRRLAAVAAIAPSVVEYCVRELHVPRERVTVIENSVDTARFEGVKPRTGEGKVFGCIGSAIPVKGHTHAVSAMARVVDSVPGARLSIAGSGPELEVLARQARDLGLESAVDLKGLVSDVPGFLAEVDILVHPSLEEAFGLALIEAMAAGRPVIASDLPATRHVLDEGRAGVLVPPADPGSLAQAMIDLAADPVSTADLAQAGRRRVEQHYCVERMVAEYAGLYRRLVRSGG